MVREIKFRVWNKNLNHWHNDNDGYMGDSEWIGINGLVEHIQHPHNNFILMQYTGLKDKNSKEIYEGDIVKYSFGGGEESNAEVDYFGASFGVNGLTLNQISYQAIEVIGNAYENPELIK